MLSGPVNVRVTRPRGQIPLGVHSSRIHTKSPSSSSWSVFCHLARVFRVGTYSWTSILQNFSKRCFTWVQARCFNVRFSFRRHAGTFAKGRPRRKWLGVNGSSSLLLLLTFVKGLEFVRLSASLTIVVKTSQVSFFELRFRRRARLTIWTSLSQGPPKCGPEGGLRRQSTELLRKCFSKNSWANFNGSLRISFRAPRKFDPLSLMNNFGWPRLASNLLIADKHVVVDRSSDTS